MLKTLKAVFARAFSLPAESSKPMPVIRKTRAIASRTVDAAEISGYAIKTGGDSFLFQTLACNGVTKALVQAQQVVSPADRKRLVLVENVGTHIVTKKLVHAGFRGTQVSASVGVFNGEAMTQHNFAWVLPDAKQVRFA